MSIKAVFFDIDGTLVDENMQTAKKTKQAIGTLKENGIKVVLCTGRSPRHISFVRKMLQLDSFICFNGAFGYFDGEVVFNHQLPYEELSALVNEAKSKENSIVFLNDIGSYSDTAIDQKIDVTFDRLKVPLPSFNPTMWQQAPTYQGYLYCSEKEEQEYVNNFPSFKFTRWHKYAVDVNNYNVNKATGIKAISDILDIDIKNTAAFGDSLNDVEMLSSVGCGVAMGNGMSEVKDTADFVTKSLEEDGIYYGLKYLDLI